jgi:RNA polymerase sigma-70 factor, ECF subfamily
MVAITSQSVQPGQFEMVDASTHLIEQAKRGNLDAFNELVLAYQDSVYRQAFWIMGEEEAAEDATQEAFIRVYRNLNTYNGGPFRPWTLRIATNYCLDQLRRMKVRKSIPLETLDDYDEEIENPTWLRDPGESVEEILERADEQARLAQCINRLAPEAKAAIVLVDIQEMNYDEAATTLGVPLSTFKSRLSRARVQLQKILKLETQYSRN